MSKHLKVLIFILGSMALMVACGAQASPAIPTLTPAPTPQPTATPEWQREGWNLVWHDEFDGPDIDHDNWKFDIGGNGWGNSEAQTYTDRPENARIEDGMLVIEARQERFVNQDHTSARLKTQGLQSWQYGRIEARIRIPEGQGIWPAFWMLGDSITTVSWPTSGEIDIMENIGREPQMIHGTVHGPGYSGGNGIGASRYLAGEPYSADFHEFAVEWEPEEIRWYMDGIPYFSLTPADVPGEWVYDQPFFILLNVAVGGLWPGYPDESTVFPQRMLVDYVRVYQTQQ
ncbi:MAG: glycoside hydrolase family 16 protein [Anaerolineae bacterium]|nr:glycoside hydrolase family 16 protein [Anaerolineae bacterium]